ncbi:hypothetical protein ACJJTC_017267 [Scirpophaga incertulas]
MRLEAADTCAATAQRTADATHDSTSSSGEQIEHSLSVQCEPARHAGLLADGRAGGPLLSERVIHGTIGANCTCSLRGARVMSWVQNKAQSRASQPNTNRNCRQLLKKYKT